MYIIIYTLKMDAKMILLLLIQLVIYCNSHDRQLNILLISTPFTGHANRVLAVGEELAVRKHNVTFCSLDNWINLKDKATDRGMKYLSAGNHGVTKFEWLDLILKRSKINGFSSGNPLGIIQELQLLSQSTPMSGTDAIARFIMSLNITQWDIIVTEHYLLHRIPCVAKSKGVPIVALTAAYYSNESPPWVFPLYQSGHSHNMTFKQRFLTGITTIGWRVLSMFSLQWYILGSPITESLCKQTFHYPIELGWEIPLIISTVIGLEYPRTISPLTAYVGPILSHKITNNKTLLPAELGKWLLNKQHKSVIYISMGSQTIISWNMAHAFIEGTRDTNYTVIWSLSEWNNNILNDFKIDNEKYFISSWIPQLSVFQHDAVIMTILHGGSNGIHESLYYGLPSIVIPDTGDQFDWAARVQNAEVGIQLLHHDISSTIITNTIHKITTGKYGEKAQFMSTLMKRGGGVKTASNLIEFYGTHGYEHLIPAPVKYQWNFIVYYNIDVLCILVLCITVLPFTCCVLCCRRKNNETKKKND